jgi:hypothetical protein
MRRKRSVSRRKDETLDSQCDQEDPVVRDLWKIPADGGALRVVPPLHLGEHEGGANR